MKTKTQCIKTWPWLGNNFLARTQHWHTKGNTFKQRHLRENKKKTVGRGRRKIKPVVVSGTVGGNFSELPKDTDGVTFILRCQIIKPRSQVKEKAERAT